MALLNYRHLRYFWEIANEQNLTRTAERLHISQSALSIQLRKLEESLGHSLFERENKRLVLTEAGRIALDYANAIFKVGDELASLLQHRSAGIQQMLRVGAVATLSRNFQIELLRPLVRRDDLTLVVHSGSYQELLTQLEAHTLDLVLANRPARCDVASNFRSYLLDDQPVSLVGPASADSEGFRFPEDLTRHPVLLPSLESDIRSAFELVLDSAGVRPNILAEVDDMAMLRLLARESGALALVPPVVVLDELRNGTLVEWHRMLDIREKFYAITTPRRFPNPIVRELLGRSSKREKLDDVEPHE